MLLELDLYQTHTFLVALVLLENFKNMYFSYEFEVALETWLGSGLEVCLMIPCLFWGLLVPSDVFKPGPGMHHEPHRLYLGQVR